MAFFTTTLELQKYLPVNGTLVVNEIRPFVELAEEQFIVQMLGRVQYASLKAAYENNNLTTQQESLLKKVQMPLAHYTLFLFADFGQVQVSSSGIHVVAGASQKSAYQWQIEALKRAYLDSADSAADQLLQFLEENATDFPSWANSEAYTITKEFFINSATEFSDYVYIKNKRRTFLQLKPAIRRVEDFHVEPTISTELFNELKSQIRDKQLNADNEIVISLIKPAVAHLALARALTDMAIDVNSFGVTVSGTSTTNNVEVREAARDSLISAVVRNAHRDGETYLKRLKHYLDNNADTYPIYKNSKQYSDPNTQSDLNSLDSPIFVV
jgi:hypothetical protein